MYTQKQVYDALCDHETLLYDNSILYKFINDTIHCRFVTEDTWSISKQVPNNPDKFEIYVPPLWWNTKQFTDYLYEQHQMEKIFIFIRPILCWAHNTGHDQNFVKKDISTIKVITALQFNYYVFGKYIDIDSKSYTYTQPLTQEEILQYLFNSSTGVEFNV